MSILLLLLLLLLSLHASDARLLRNGGTSKQVDHETSNTIKDDTKLDQARVSNEAERKPKYSLANNGTRDIAKDFDDERRAVVDEAKGGTESGAGRSGEERVAWKVPHKKGGQPQPGFNLDYLPPKTHPPVHN